jgi:hypothetical protein
VDSSVEYRLELAGVQVPPLTLFTVIVAGQLFLAVRTSKFRASRVLHLHVDLLRLLDEFDRRSKELLCQADAVRVPGLTLLRVHVRRNCTITHTKPGWTSFLESQMRSREFAQTLPLVNVLGSSKL